VKVMLLGRDTAPSKAFTLLASELGSRSCEVFLYAGENGADEYRRHISNPVSAVNVLLLGMSSSEKLAADEIYAAETAAKLGVPYGFYADTFGVINHPWFSHLREGASFVFVINEKEAEAARKIFPTALVVVSGNPTWEDFFTPKLSREEARSRLEVREGENMVLCPGGKSLAINMLCWGGVIEALSSEPVAEMWKVFLSVHPMDANGADAYRELAKYSKRVPVRIMTKDHMSSSDMIPGSDFVIESASTVGIEAACQRKPVIEYFSEIGLTRLEGDTGSRSWDLCESGAALRVVGNPNNLISVIHQVLLYGGGKEMRSRQEELYPAPPEKGAAVRTMAAVLMEMSKK